MGNVINVLALGYRFKHDDEKFRYLSEMLSGFLKHGPSAMGFVTLSICPWLRHIPLFGIPLIFWLLVLIWDNTVSQLTVQLS